MIATGNQRILIRCATHRGRRSSPFLQGVILLAPCPYKEGGGNVNVVTYEELFQLLIFLVSFASLIVAIMTKKK